MYKYYKRPCYGSDDLLIEFISGPEEVNFISDLFATLSGFNPKIKDLVDAWYNDEVLLHVQTDIGGFVFSKDIWDFAFIMVENNNAIIDHIDDVLSKNHLYEKLDPNPDIDYKLL
ncbi:hypothetical protein ACX0HA_09445 [Flavobacterium hauense]